MYICRVWWARLNYKSIQGKLLRRSLDNCHFQYFSLGMPIFTTIRETYARSTLATAQ